MNTPTISRRTRPTSRQRIVVAPRIARVSAPHIPKVGIMLSAAVRHLAGAWEALAPGTWAVEIRTMHHRSQVVSVRHDESTDRIEFTSAVGPFRSSLGTTELLRRAADIPLGRLCVEEASDGVSRLFIRHQQPRTVNVNDIVSAISMIGWAADALELELFARDTE